MHKEFSPEERLLRLIRSKPAKPSQTVPEQPQQPKGQPALKPSSRLPPKVPAPRPIKIFRLENLNLILVILLTGLLSYFIPLFFKSQKSSIKTLEEKIKAQEKVESQKGLVHLEEKRPSFDYFSGQVGARNIFSPLISQEVQPQAAIEQGPKLEDIKAQLSLLGIIWTDKPQAIIEDKKAQKTYFLNKGETFDDIEVQDILENKVILIYKGKQFELVL